MKKNRKIALEKRNCVSCGNYSLERLWSHTFYAKTRNINWEFEINNVICKDCGFVFVSPTPAQKDLIDYYSDPYTPYDGQALDYDIDKRISFINENVEKKNTYIEIGSNKQSGFHKKLGNIFDKIVTVEINRSVESDLRATDTLSENQADVLAHYFVLEHVSDIGGFLKQCHKALKPGGTMICEVPDIELYPNHLSPLMLHEHVNHFSQTTLRGIIENKGFHFKNCSHSFCSRPFGVAMAFVKDESPRLKASCLSFNEYKRNKLLILKPDFPRNLTMALIKIL